MQALNLSVNTLRTKTLQSKVKLLFMPLSPKFKQIRNEHRDFTPEFIDSDYLWYFLRIKRMRQKPTIGL